MDRTMKVFFFFCFVVFFFTGCGKNGNRNEKINGPDSKDAARSAMQLKAETQVKELEELSKLLRTADTLFTQVWVHIEQYPDANPNNVFRVVRTQIDTIQKVEKKFKENPEAPRETDKNKKQKPLSADLGEVQIFIKVAQKTLPAPAHSVSQASTTSASATATTNPTAGKQTTPTPPRVAGNQQKSPITQPEKMTNQYRLHFKKKNSEAEPELAAFEKMADGKWRIQFFPRNLGYEFNGLGRLSVLMNENEVICDLTPSKQGRLEKMNCSNIGQDLNGIKIVHLKKFEVDTQAEIKLTVKGEIVDDVEKKSPPVTLLIKDYDAQNKLIFDITKIIESVEPEKSEAPKATDQGANGAQGAAPSEAGNTTSGATGENKESNGSQSGDAANGNDRVEDKESKDKKEDGRSGQSGTSEAQPGEGGQQNDQGADAAGAGGELPLEAVT